MLDRETRRLIHTKQDRIQIKTGSIALNELIEGDPAFSYITGLGLYLIVKYNNEMYHVKLTKGVPA